MITNSKKDKRVDHENNANKDYEIAHPSFGKIVVGLGRVKELLALEQFS